MTNPEGWSPHTFEDRLLQAYLQENPGRLYLEVRVGGSEDPSTARRLDAVLIPGPERLILPARKYSERQLREDVRSKVVEVIEAKRTLNRNVIGQALVGRTLFGRELEPHSVKAVALCAAGQTDLEWVCGEHQVAVSIIPIDEPASTLEERSGRSAERSDVRKGPTNTRRRAFLGGWSDAVKGQLYRTARKRKSHANMGNLFGWIYGDQDIDFRLETWDRYVDSLDTVDRKE